MKSQLQTELYHTIPLVQALQLQVTEADVGRVVFDVPLAPNLNDKGCAFGGSLASVLTLASWSVLTCLTWHANIKADVFVHTSDIVYRSPIWKNFKVVAALDQQTCDQFLQNLKEQGKAAVIIKAQAMDDDQVAVNFSGRFVAMRHQT
jgi:thioesterase domain-containing protein